MASLGGSHGCPFWQTISIGHGFIWEGHSDILHCDAVHDGGEGLQIVDIRRVSCEQVICKEKVGRCYLGDKSVLRPRQGLSPLVFPDRWVRKAQGPTPQPMPLLVLCAHVCVCVCARQCVLSDIPWWA